MDDTFNVIKKNGSTLIFRKSDRGIYFLGTAKEYNIVFVNTVMDNQYKYSTRSYSQAMLARKLQRIVGRGSTHEIAQ
jgi:hypothetical protein